MGGKAGWIIAGVLVVFVAVLVIYLVFFPSPSDPTMATRAKGFMEIKAPKVDIQKVIGLNPSGPGNAADDYIKVVNLFKDSANSELLGEAVDVLEGDMQATLPANLLDLLTKAADLCKPALTKKDMQFTFHHTPKKFRGLRWADGRLGFVDVHFALQYLRIHHYRKKEISKALELLRQQFVLGWHVMNERVRGELTITGMDIQLDAADTLVRFFTPEQAPNQDAIRRYHSELSDARAAMESKNRVVWDSEFAPGDAFNILRHDEDRTWRVETLLAMCKMKVEGRIYERGDTKLFQKLLGENLAGGDPFLQAAAETLRDCTREQVQSWARTLER
jgi:hypothetical protein